MLNHGYHGVVISAVICAAGCEDSCATRCSDSCLTSSACCAAHSARLFAFTANVSSSFGFSCDDHRPAVQAARQAAGQNTPRTRAGTNAASCVGVSTVCVQLTPFRFAFDFHGFIYLRYSHAIRVTRLTSSFSPCFRPSARETILRAGVFVCRCG